MRNLAVPVTIYLGSGQEGLALYEALQKQAKAEGMSLSEWAVKAFKQALACATGQREK